MPVVTDFDQRVGDMRSPVGPGQLIVYSRILEAGMQKDCGLSEEFIDIDGNGKRFVPMTNTVSDPAANAADDPNADPLQDIRKNGGIDAVVVGKTTPRSQRVFRSLGPSNPACG
jgi:hypothetical protein